MIKKTSETTPTMASIVDGYSTSTKDGYSCNYVNKNLVYSTDEVDTGKIWIDGKHIYRRVFTGTTNTSGGTNNIFQCNTFIDFGGYIHQDANTKISLNIAWGTDGNQVARLIQQGTNINLQTGSSFYGKNYVLWVEYTKSS